MTEKWTGVSKSYVTPQASGAADAWTQESAGSGGQRLSEVAEVTPPREVQAALGLAAGETVWVRRREVTLDGVVIELAHSYYPIALAAGTALTERKRIRGGAPTLLASLGYRSARVIEEIEARGATPAEAQALTMQPGAPVLELRRTNVTSAGKPYEAMVMVMKTPRVLRYEMEVD